MSLATTTDVAARLGRDLGTAETTAVTFLLDGADEVIAAAAGVPSTSLDATTTPVLRFVAVAAVCRAMANPQGIASLQETLGQYGNTVRFRDLDMGGDLWLNDRETLMVRRAVHGQLSGSVKVASTSDEVYDSLYGS